MPNHHKHYFLTFLSCSDYSEISIYFTVASSRGHFTISFIVAVFIRFQWLLLVSVATVHFWHSPYWLVFFFNNLTFGIFEFSPSYISWRATCGFFVHSNRASLFDQSLTSCLSICTYLLILVALSATKFTHTPPPSMALPHANLSC